MTVLGLPLATFICFFLPLALGILAIIPAVRGSYEGRKVEEKYGVDEWYYTF